MKKHFWLILFLLPFCVKAQSLDRIMAIVGDEVILESEVENQYNYLIQNGQKDDGSLFCGALEQRIVSKLLFNKAQQDSLTVGDDEITSEVDRRVEMIMQRTDGKVGFEEIAGKSVGEFKSAIREDIKEEMLIDRERSKVLANASITPKEVQDFYNNIPKDSLGLLPAEVEINHIVVVPPFSEESKKAAKDKLNGIRKKILEEKADFGEMASKYSMEPGATRSKGSLGDFSRGQMVPEFESVVYSMRVGEISDVFETEYGYHIVKLMSRKGEVVNASHILIIPSRSTNADSMAISKLQKAYDLIKKDSITFEQAAIKYSEDRTTKDCGGCVMNPKTGDLRIPMNALDTEFFFKVDKMKKGEVSKPMEYYLPNGTRAFHLLYIKNKIPPHAPNLKDDYKKIQAAALQAKQNEVFEKWLKTAKKNVFIEIKEGTDCFNALKYWMEQ